MCVCPMGNATRMWMCVCLVLLVQGSRISSLPLQEALSASIPESPSVIIPEVTSASTIIPDTQSATIEEAQLASISETPSVIVPEVTSASIPNTLSVTNTIEVAQSESKNATENTRPVRQLDFTECCPCPKNYKNKNAASDEVLEALPSNPVRSSVLPKGSERDVLPDDDDSVDGCDCQLRDADAAAAASKDLSSKMSALRSAVTQVNGAASEEPSILKPEVSLASSFLETLRDATDEEYRDAVARDAEKNLARSRNAEPEGNSNVVNIIVAPYEDKAREEEEEALSKAANAQNSKRTFSLARKNKPVTSLIREKLGLPTSRTLKDRNVVDNKSSPSQVVEKSYLRQDEQKNIENVDQNSTVKQNNERAKANDMDSFLSASSNIETFAPNTKQLRSNVEERGKPLGRSSISDDFLNLKNVKDLVGEREVKLKVPYLKVPSLINKDAGSRNSGRKIPTLGEWLEDIISPYDNVRQNQASEKGPQAKEEFKEVVVTNDLSKNNDDDDDNKKFKTRILDSLPNPSQQVDDLNTIPSESFTPSFSVPPVDPERENVEGDASSQESDNYPNDPIGSHSMPNPTFVQPMSPVFIPEERSSNEINSIEEFTDDTNPNQVGESKGNGIKSESNRSAILERLDKLSKISNDLEKIKDLVEDMSKSKLETKQPKSADSDTGASDRHENISLLPHKVLKAPETLSSNLKKIGHKLRSNKKGMLGSSSDRIQSLTFPRLSDLTAKPFDVFNLMLPQDKIVQPSFIDPGKLLPWNINDLRARAVPELPSVDEIRDRISDFIGRSGLGINAFSDMDDDSNTNVPRFALGKPRANQQTELVDLDVFRLRPVKMAPSSKSRAQQPVQGFNLEKFKAKVQVPTKSVKAVELQSSFGKDGRIVGGRFSLQPPSKPFWDKVRNTKSLNNSNLSKKQPISSLDSLKSDMKARTDSILGSVKSNAPSLSSPLEGGIRPLTSLTPFQKTSASIINEVKKRVDNVLEASNYDQKDLSLKDSLLERKATIENRLQEIHSGLVQQISSIEPLNTKNTHTNLLGARSSNQKDLSLTDSLMERKATIENRLQEIHSDLVNQISGIEPLTIKNARTKDSRTVETKINKPHKSSLLGKTQPQPKRFGQDAKLTSTKKRINRPKSNIELRDSNANNAKSTQPMSRKANSSPNRRLKDANFSPSDSIAIKTLPDKTSLKRVNYKDNLRSQTTQIGKLSSNYFEGKDNSETNLKSSLPLFRSTLKRKNVDNFESASSTTISPIPSIKNLRNRSHKVTQHVRSPEKLTSKSIILKESQPINDARSNEKLTNAVFEKINEKIQSRLTDIDARAKEILQSSKHVLPEEPQLGVSENQKRFPLQRPIKQEDKENIKRQDSHMRESSSASGPSWQKLTERIQSRLSEADAAVKKSLEKSNQKQWSKLQGDTPSDMTEDASETETKRLNSPGSSTANTNGPSLQKFTERIQSRFSKPDSAVKKSFENLNPVQRSKGLDNTHDMSEGASETETKRLNSPERLLVNLKSKLSEANEAFKQALQNTKFAKDSDSKPSEHSEARTKSESSDTDDRPLATLTEKLHGRLSGTGVKNLFHGSKDKQTSQSEVQDVSENFDSKRQSQDTLVSKRIFGQKISKLLHNPKLSQESDLEQRATEIHDLSGNKESSPKNDALPLDKLREKIQSRFAETDKAFKNGLKGPLIVQPTHGVRSVENIEDFGTENITPLKNSRPLLDKITEKIQNRNKFVSSEIVEMKSSRDSSGDSLSSNIMKVPLLERLAENHRHPSLSRSIQPILGAAPTYMRDQNEGASEVFESSFPVRTGSDMPPRTSPLLGRLTEKFQSKILRDENKSSNSEEDDLPKFPDKLASRNTDKPMKQNVTYRCRMVCEEV